MSWAIHSSSPVWETCMHTYTHTYNHTHTQTHTHTHTHWCTYAHTLRVVSTHMLGTHMNIWREGTISRVKKGRVILSRRGERGRESTKKIAKTMGYLVTRSGQGQDSNMISPLPTTLSPHIRLLVLNGFKVKCFNW